VSDPLDESIQAASPHVDHVLEHAGSSRALGDALRDLFAIVVVDSAGEDGIITGANTMLYELAGYEPEELIGAKLDVLIPERSVMAHKHYRLGYMHNPVARPMGPDREVVLLHKDGREIRVWIGLAPVVGEEGATTAVILPMDIGRSFGLDTRRRRSTDA
jgi:PAS domain S-box-containing protein